MRSPDFVIGPFESPYMLRWYMIPRNRWFGIYWHSSCVTTTTGPCAITRGGHSALFCEVAISRSHEPTTEPRNGNGTAPVRSSCGLQSTRIESSWRSVRTVHWFTVKRCSLWGHEFASGGFSARRDGFIGGSLCHQVITETSVRDVNESSPASAIHGPGAS